MAEFGLIERFKIAWATFRRLGGVELPDTGRSSVETVGASMSAYLESFGSISPVINFEMLKVLKCFSLYNPDFTQYIANVVNLGNPGHQLAVEAANDSIAESAVARLNEASARIYRQGVGVDGLINQYLTSLTWSGAISSEDVVNFAGGRVEKVVLVPVEQIRFRYNKDTDNYDAYQRATNLLQRPENHSPLGLIPLNPETYRYYALSTVENSPYAKPPGSAAIDAILDGQKPIMDNIRFVAKKFGLLGLVAVSVTPPRRNPGETEPEYNARAKTYLQSISKSLDGNFNKGLVATFADQKVEHTRVATDAGGVYELNRLSEEQVFSGLGTYPAFHGRTDSTTETFADVVYYLLTAQVGNMQRVVKRRQERTYMLDLRLGGIDVDSVSLNFNKAHSRNALQEAQTEEQRFNTVLEKVKVGLITPDEGARELGEENWFDEEKIFGDAMPPAVPVTNQDNKQQKRTLTLVFNKQTQQYRYQPERIELIGSGAEREDDERVLPFIKKKAHQA
jgi:hypothetical protein